MCVCACKLGVCVFTPAACKHLCVAAWHVFVCVCRHTCVYACVERRVCVCWRSLHEAGPHASEGPHHGVEAPPVHAAAVLAGTQEELAPPVVGVLVEHPVALDHVGGEDVTVTEAVEDVGAVVHELHHVTSQVGTVVDPHAVGASVL